MKRLVESVPNFSEGRDMAKVDAIIAAMREVPGVYLLDRESDADHNRSVVTIAGEPDAVAEAALRGVGKAAELIDLTERTLADAFAAGQLRSVDLKQVQIAGRALVYGFARMNIDGHFPRWGVGGAEAEKTAEAILDLFIEGIASRS